MLFICKMKPFWYFQINQNFGPTRRVMVSQRIGKCNDPILTPWGNPLVSGGGLIRIFYQYFQFAGSPKKKIICMNHTYHYLNYQILQNRYPPSRRTRAHFTSGMATNPSTIIVNIHTRFRPVATHSIDGFNSCNHADRMVYPENLVYIDEEPGGERLMTRDRVKTMGMIPYVLYVAHHPSFTPRPYPDRFSHNKLMKTNSRRP